MAYKKVVVFSGKREMSQKEAIAHAKLCLNRVSRGDVAALHDVWYIVNILGVSLDTFTDNPEKIANNPYFNRLETLV